MASDLAEAIRQLIYEKGISEDLVLKTIEDALLAAYKKRYGTAENAVVRFTGEYEGVEILAKRTIVDELDDPVLEISLDEAKELVDGAELGDILEIPIDPREFDLQEVMLAKQTTRQSLREISRDTLYAEYKAKQGEIIIGYYQREKGGNIFVDLGRVEGFFPKKFQSPRETYQPGERIKALIAEVSKNGPQIVLSRTHPEFVQKILELEVPEVYDKTIEVFKIVREPGYRTKIAVYSKRDDVDPVGACVGLKGIRIQSIIRELEGEKIDVLKYEIDPRRFIKNALSPADVREVYIIDEARHTALAVVDESQLSVAIGKQGLNVRLANRLCDWSIDVKTEEQFRELDLSSEARRAASSLFGDEEEILRLDELPGLDPGLVAALAGAGIEMIEDFLARSEDELLAIEGVAEDALSSLRAVIDENVEVIEEEIEENAVPAEAMEPPPVEQEDVEQETYECPDCHAVITPDMTHCPQCGVALSFEYEDAEAEAEDQES
ncbi:MAG TPA: transcription termination factor NusA [Spirochaetales bacterium]|nr:transcription termination factor NusA [Spirochaetales bacterium]HPM72918.1 transcription termination factor NusA [Spirochaetales bacterium]